MCDLLIPCCISVRGNSLLPVALVRKLRVILDAPLSNTPASPRQTAPSAKPMLQISPHHFPHCPASNILPSFSQTTPHSSLLPLHGPFLTPHPGSPLNIQSDYVPSPLETTQWLPPPPHLPYHEPELSTGRLLKDVEYSALCYTVGSCC